MKPSTKEPKYFFSEEDVAQKSRLANDFIQKRILQNQAVLDAGNKLIQRIYNLDHNTYLEGVLSSKYKELMGLVASAVLRCDDCVFYHIIQSYRLGATRPEIEESLNVAAVVGGTIVIPHLRRAYSLLQELY
jgi:AhpD family alkylhydroperoxidase